MDGLLFSEAEMQVLRESPAYREIMANVQKAVAERAATVGKSMRVEATIPAIEGVQSNVGESRGIAAVPKVATCIGNRAGSDAVTSIALVPPIKVGKLGETVREYNRFESIFGAPRRYRDVLTSKEGQVVEDCVGVDDEVFRDTGGDTLDQSVTMVTENTLECALGVPLHTTLGKARSIGGLMVEVTDGDAELAFGPAACYLQAVLGRGVSVGVFLAWYVRAVVRGYAGSVELRCQRGKWCIRSGRGMPLDCLRQVIGYIGERFSPFDEKVVLKCKNLNPHKVLHPYEWLRQDFPKDCCGELLRAPYCYVVSAVTGTYIGDGVDVAVGQIVGGGAFPCSLEKTNFLYSTSSLSKQEVILSQEVLDGFGKCANYMALNCVDGRMRFAEYVAWCVWLARRGITVHNELSRVDDRWHVKPRRYANAMNAVVAMLTVAAKVYFDTNGPGYTRNIRHIEKLCGFVCNGVSEKLVGFRFEDLEDPRKGSKIGGRVFV